MKQLFVLLPLAFLFAACPAQRVAKTDLEFRGAMEESAKNKDKPLDFLAGEQLPNPEFVPVDTASAIVAAVTPGVTEVKPSKTAKYRIQVFAGSAENAQKNFEKFSSDTSYKDVALIHDDDDKWKVWVGGYATHEAATTAKQRFIDQGYVDVWVNEMKGTYRPVGLFWVQVGSFQSESAAGKLSSDLAAQFATDARVEKVGSTFKVWLGGVSTRADADVLKQKLQTGGYPKAFVVESK